MEGRAAKAIFACNGLRPLAEITHDPPPITHEPRPRAREYEVERSGRGFTP
jgi:hypothetical protein